MSVVIILCSQLASPAVSCLHRFLSNHQHACLHIDAEGEVLTFLDRKTIRLVITRQAVIGEIESVWWQDRCRRDYVAELSQERSVTCHEMANSFHLTVEPLRNKSQMRTTVPLSRGAKRSHRRVVTITVVHDNKQIQYTTTFNLTIEPRNFQTPSTCDLPSSSLHHP